MRIFRRVGRVWWVVLGCLVVIVSVGLWWVLMNRTPSKEQVMVEVAKAQASAEAVADRLGIVLSGWESWNHGCIFAAGNHMLEWDNEGFLEDVSVDAAVSLVEAAIEDLGGQLEGRWELPVGVIVGARWPSGSRYSVDFEIYEDGRVKFVIITDCYYDTTTTTATTMGVPEASVG